MRVLVTGHEGYIGSVLAPVLAEAGHEVVGLDTGFYDTCLLGPPPPPVPTIRLDLRDVTPDLLAGFDAVVHLAALSNDPLGDLAPEITYAINRDASLRLAAAAQQAGVARFLYASTCSVYGAGGDGLVDESAALRPLTPYAISKIEVERGLHRLAGDTFCPVSLRNATAFGHSPRLRGDIVLNNLMAWAYLTGTVRVLSDGTPWRPLVHVRDIAAAFLAALEAPADAVHDRAFNIGSEVCNVQVRDIAEAAAQEVPGATVDITGETGNDPRSYRVDFSAFRRAVPGFRTAWTIEDGARELHEAYRRFGLTMDDFTGRFTRLARLRDLQAAGRLSPDLRWAYSGADVS